MQGCNEIKPRMVHPCTNAFTEAVYGGSPGPAGEDRGEETFPPSPHNEPIVGRAGGGIGEQDRPRRQAHEAVGGDAKGSHYREFCASDLQLQCLKSPNCDGEK